MFRTSYCALSAIMFRSVCGCSVPRVTKQLRRTNFSSALAVSNRRVRLITPVSGGHIERNSSSSAGAHIVEIRGLDPETKEEEIFGFFRSLNITPASINLRCDNSGRVSGVCEVQFSSYAEAVAAMRKKNSFIGNRFIRLKLKSPDANVDDNKSKDGVAPTSSGHHVRMKGVPNRITEQAIYAFFCPLNIHPIAVRSAYDENGHALCEYDVEFLTHEDAVRAMSKNNAYLGRRFVELILNSEPESADDREISSEYRKINQSYS